MWQSRWVNERETPCLKTPLTVEESGKQSIKRQLDTTLVGAVGWEPHSSSTMTCAAKVDHELYHIYISAISCGQWQPWIAVSPLLGLISMAWPSVSDEGKPVYKRPFPTEVSPLSASSTQHMWGLLAGNCMAVIPRHVRGRRIIGLVYVCPLL